MIQQQFPWQQILYNKTVWLPAVPNVVIVAVKSSFWFSPGNINMFISAVKFPFLLNLPPRDRTSNKFSFVSNQTQSVTETNRNGKSREEVK